MKLTAESTVLDDKKIGNSFATLQVDADGIRTEVSRKVGNDEVISRINQSPESIQIQANRVDITGTAVFNAVNADASTKSAMLNSEIEVGGRNLSTGTAETQILTTAANQSWFTPIPYTLSSYGGSAITDTNNATVAFSFDYSITGVDTAFNLMACLKSTSSSYNNAVQVASIPVGNSSGKGYGVLTINDGARQYAAGNGILFSGSGNANANAELTVSNFKVEIGNKATDWTPAPEDVQAEIDAKKSTFTINATGTDASQPYSQILVWAQEGRQLTWAVDSTAGIKVGDTVRIKTTVSDMSNAPVYVVAICREAPTSSTIIKTTSHGLDTTIIDGGNILTNSIGANQIAANSITANKIRIGDYNNYITANENDTSSMNFNSEGDYEFTNGWIYKKVATNSNLWVSPILNNWTADGEKYRITGKVKMPVAGKCYVAIQARNASGAWASNASTPTIDVSTSETIFNQIITIPSGFSANPKCNIGIYFYAVESGANVYKNGYFKQMRCERMSGGSLIVDGSITADKVAANSINTSKMAIGDWTNLVTANELYPDSMPIDNVVISNGYLVKKDATQQYLQLSKKTPNFFKTGDELYVEFYAKAASSTNIIFYLYGYDKNETYIDGCANAATINNSMTIPLTTNEVFYSGTITLSATQWNTAAYYMIDINNSSTTKVQIYVRKAIVRRKNEGNLIVDGAITTDKIQAGAITANKIRIGDFNNYITVTEKDANSIIPNSGCEISNGWLHKIADEGNLWLSPVQSNWTTAGEQYRVTGKVKTPASGRVFIYICGRDANGTSQATVSHETIPTVANTETIINTVITVNESVANQPKVNIYAYFFVGQSSGSTQQQGYLKNLKVERMAGGSLIVDGAITGEKIYANSINTSKLAVGDWTNLVTANEMYPNSLPASTVSISNGYLVKTTATNQYILLTRTNPRTPNTFKTNDELYVEFYAKAASATTASFAIYAYDASNTYIGGNTAWLNGATSSSTFTIPTTETKFSGTIYLSDAVWDTAKYYEIDLNNSASTKVQIYLRKVVVRRKNEGNLIVDGAITADKLDAITINASKKLTVGAMTDSAQSSILNSNITIGGKNLFFNTGTANGYYINVTPNGTNASYDAANGGFYRNLTATTEAIVYSSLASTEQLVGTEYYTHTLWVKSSVARNFALQLRKTTGMNDGGGYTSSSQVTVPANTWTKLTHTFKGAATVSAVYARLYAAAGTACNVYVKEWKLEKGNKATDWMPSPEDETNDNLLVGSQKMSQWPRDSSAALSTSDTFGVVTLNGTASNWSAMVASAPPISISTLNGTPMCLSFEYKASISTNLVPAISASSVGEGVMPSPRTLYKTWEVTLPAATAWTRYVIPIPITTVTELMQGSGTANSMYVQFYNRTDNSTFQLRKVKLEYGTYASQWTPSAEEYKTYITRIDENGIFVSSSSQVPSTSAPGNSVKINSDGLYVYQGGVERAYFKGDAAAIGTIGQNRAIMDANGLNVYKYINSVQTSVAQLNDTSSRVGIASSGHTTVRSDGLHVWINAESTPTNEVAFFGATARIGKPTGANTGNVYIDDNTVYIRKGSTVLSTFTASGAELGKNSNTATINMCNNAFKINGQYEQFISASDTFAVNIKNIASTAYRKVEIGAGDESCMTFFEQPSDQYKSPAINIYAGSGLLGKSARISLGLDQYYMGQAEVSLVSEVAVEAVTPRFEITKYIYSESGSLYYMYSAPSTGSQSYNAVWTKVEEGGNTNYRLGRPSSSSRRYKEDIKPVESDKLDPHRLYNIPVMQFKYKEGYFPQGDEYEENRTDVIGFIAEDVLEHYPQAAIIIDEEVDNWNERYIIPPMLKLIQEQNDRITELERRLS